MKVETFGKAGVSVPPRLVALSKFLIVGLTGIAVNEVVYVGLVSKLAVWFVLAAILSTQASTTWNFLGNELWAFSGRQFHGHILARYIAYSGMNNSMLLLRVPMLWVLTDFGHLRPAWSNLIALGALFVLRFAFSDGFVWRTKAVDPYAVDTEDETGEKVPLYRYDLGGLLRLDSESELPELAYFRTAATTKPDIRIRIRRVGGFFGTKVRLLRDGERVTYREHLGVLGADFNVTMGTPIEVEASPLLALSRHVLYTNVVEALLRFVLVSKGYVLLHSAGLEVNGEATLLSAQTDTGKTSTVINLVRERHWRFISDDMAIIDPAGFVRTFPKPMTLSYHTMTRAVDASTLSPKKRMQLQVQSRVHSKSGRTVGKGLGTLNVPIMSINSVLQIMVPPPKYHITALMPAHIATETPIAHVFLMERGEPIQEQVALEAAIDQLIENTDDAYGFPPFSTLAPNFVIGGADYQQLRARERELLTSALANVPVWRLRVRGHEWGELLPRLILGEDASDGSSDDDGEPRVGIPIETHDREPVGIPIESGERVRAGYSGALNASAAAGPSASAAASAAFATGVAGAAGITGAAGMARARSSGRARGNSYSGGSYGRDEGPPRPPDRAEPNLPRRTVPQFEADVMAMSSYRPFPSASQFLPTNRVSRTATFLPRATDRTGILDIANVRTSVLLAGILFVAAVLRLWAITTVGLNNDEAVYAGQGAALAGDPVDSTLFAIFRAHPLLVQFLFSIPYRLIGVNDLTPRLIAVAFGVAGVWLCYATASLLYGRRAGLIAAAVLAFMPYHVVVTRQALLDGPETTLFLLAVYLLARFCINRRSRWLYAAAFAAGLTVLAKETAILLVPVVVAFLLLTPQIRVGFRRLVVSGVIFVLAVAPYPASILIGKGTSAAQSFLLWQVLRQPNHTWTFYADVLPGAVGPLIVIAAAVGLFVAIRQAGWQDRLLVAWIGVPIAFFELWPVKGFQYLLPISPAIAILVGLTFDRLIKRGTEADEAARVRELNDEQAIAAALAAAAKLGRSTPAPAEAPDAAAAPAMPSLAAVPAAQSIADRPTPARRGTRRHLMVAASAALLVVTIASIAVPTALAVNSTTMTSSLAGTGGLPGGREAGLWIRDNVPQGATFLTEGPTLANIVEFYGQRRAYGLSVSPNPLRRNPAYDPINNPDRALQLDQIQYIATDIWSAQRSAFFDTLLRRYVARYHGHLVYEQRAQVRDYSGNVSTQVVIQIYEVRP
jgi:4-amino-4-deoxy-L-arabinose transferase-like glycosyltransferase/putative flippase GtrA